MVHNLKIKKIIDDLDNINYGREGDVAIDLRASGHWIINLDDERKEISQNDYALQPGERVLIKTGVKMAIPPGNYGHICGRSGLAMKNGLQPLGGVIDENYREELGVILMNHGNKTYTLTKNEKVAQLIIKPYTKVNIEYVQDLDKTSRDEGFGSSGRY